MKDIKKYSIYIFGLVFFSVFFYMELEEIGGIKFSHLWKMPFVVYLASFLLIRKVNRKKFISLSYALSFEKLLNVGFMTNAFSNITETIRYMNFPLLYQFLLIKIKSADKFKSYSIILAQYSLLSFLPFTTGLVQERVDRVSMIMEKYDVNIDASSTAGIFQTQHAASIIVVLALLILIFNLFIDKNSKSNSYKIFNLLLIIFGLFILYRTYVRTGYIMMIFGCLVLFAPHRISLKSIAKPIGLIIALYLSVITLMSTNDYFRKRILDEDQNGQTSSHIGSGRTLFWEVSFNYWANSNTGYNLLFGHGLENVKSNMKEKIGLEISSHNAYLDALSQNGLIGLILLLLFQLTLLMHIIKLRRTPSFRLAIAWYISYIIFQIVQGGAGFITDLFICLILGRIQKEQDTINFRKKSKYELLTRSKLSDVHDNSETRVDPFRI